MKKIALMMTTLFALTNIVIPSTATYALEQIRIVESFDECDNLNEFNTSNNEIIEENISEDNAEDNAEDKENIIEENVENSVENQEDVEALEDVTEESNINYESNTSNDEAQEEKEISEENIDDSIYKKVKRNPEELNDVEILESDIQVITAEKARFTSETPVESDIYIATEDVEYHVETEGESIILVGEYSDGTTATSKEVAFYDDALIEQLEQEEFKANYENALNFEYLVKKTDANYEIVEAYSDGNFSYIESADTIEEAMSIALDEYKDDSAIPCVIDNYGVVVYSTNAMARFFKHTNGKVDNSNVTMLYQNSNLSGITNYTNHNYLDDAPVIEDNGNAVRVMVNGYKGWTKKDTNTGTYDVVIVPMNQATNPSYYTVNNGQLQHYITTDITAKSGTSGSIRTVGVAPSYLQEGVKYYSYDARYFYTNLNTLINDLKGNTYGNAVNGSNPYYNYYQYLPFRSKRIYSAGQLNSFIEANTQSNSKLRGIGQYLINAQNAYGVNALLILGVAINESAWGMSSYAQNRNNLFGLNAVDSNPDDASRFNSVEHCINEFAKYWISSGYSDPQDSRYYGGFVGNKYMGANVKYASDPFWGEKAASYAFTADKYLSGNNINSLNDYNYNQLAIYSATGRVVDKNNNLLYNVSNTMDYYVTFVGVPVVLTTTKTYTIGQDVCYEVYPERTTPLSSSGGSEFSGNYDWNIKGYIKTSNVKLINTEKNNSTANEAPGITYQAHSAKYMWLPEKNEGEVAGTVNQSLRMEAIRISLQGYEGASVKYRVRGEGYNWQDWARDGQVAGTTGQSKRMEAIQIVTEGMPKGHYLQYRVLVQDYGWMSWKNEGETAGTINEWRRIEAIQIRIIKEECNIQYRTHLADTMWQDWRYNGQMAGTVNQWRRMEAIEIIAPDLPEGASIRYKAHLAGTMWNQGWVYDGATAGTTGQSRRMEAIIIDLVNAPDYDVMYRVRGEGYGWTEWKTGGQIAGTTGQGKRMEAIEIKLIRH